MIKETEALSQDYVKKKIHVIRGMKVLLDRDLAELYGVLTKNLNKAVKRNIDRFPEGYMIQLTKEELESLRFQNGTSSDSLRFQNGTIKSTRGRHIKYLPYAFTEQGVAMLSGVLKSETAVRVSIQIVDTFVAMRKYIATNAGVFQRLDNVEKKQLVHDKQFELVFDAIESKEIKKQGIFYDGQVFDAYKFVSDIVESAKKSIILFDNYVDTSVLTLLAKERKE